jgi:putative ABC transport system substrate-binding protein
MIQRSGGGLTFRQESKELGWSEGDNLRLEYRVGHWDADKHRKECCRTGALKADVILAYGSTIPIVFVSVADPVFRSKPLARPGGNTTGFTPLEYAQSGKWLEVLKETSR